MAFTYLVNQSLTSNYSEYHYQIKEQLKLVGWTVESSGDGLTFSMSGDIINNTATSGAGSMNNNYAWWVMSHPTLDGYKRYMCTQVTTGGKYDVRVKMAWSPFNGGIPSAIRTPSSISERVIGGAGTDIAPSGMNILDSTLANSRYHIIVGDATEGYAFFFFATKVGTGTLGSLWMMEKISDAHVLDIDPYIYYVNGGSSFPTAINNYSGNPLETNSVYLYMRKGMPGESIGQGYISWYSTAINTAGNQCIGNLGTNAYDGKDDLLPAICFSAQVAPNPSYKGKLANIRLSCVARASLDTSNSKNRIYIGPFNLPWNGSTPLI